MKKSFDFEIRPVAYFIIFFLIYLCVFYFESLTGLTKSEFFECYNLDDPYLYGSFLVGLCSGLGFSYLCFYVFELLVIIPWQKLFKRKSPPPADSE